MEKQKEREDSGSEKAVQVKAKRRQKEPSNPGKVKSKKPNNHFMRFKLKARKKYAGVLPTRNPAVANKSVGSQWNNATHGLRDYYRKKTPGGKSTPTIPTKFKGHYPYAKIKPIKGTSTALPKVPSNIHKSSQLEELYYFNGEPAITPLVAPKFHLYYSSEMIEPGEWVDFFDNHAEDFGDYAK